MVILKSNGAEYTFVRAARSARATLVSNFRFSGIPLGFASNPVRVYAAELTWWA
jgi:hypothetical protein